MQKKDEPTEKEQIQMQEMFSKLSELDNPYLFRKMALEEIVKLLSIKGYSTILWMNRFYSKVTRKGVRGRTYSYIHTNNPPEWLQKLYDEYVNRSSSIIEEAIYKKYPKEEFGFVTMRELLDEKVVSRNIIGFLAWLAGVREMGYLWLQITKNDMWAFCLRKFTDEPDFTEHDAMVLKIIGEQFLQMRRKWWRDQLVDPQNVLSERQLEVFDLHLQGWSQTKIAEKLGLSAGTVKTHFDYAKDKIKVDTQSLGKIDNQIIDKQLKILTPYQREILKLLSEEMTQAMVAEKLGRTFAAVNSQMNKIYKKLETHSLRETINKLREIS